MFYAIKLIGVIFCFFVVRLLVTLEDYWATKHSKYTTNYRRILQTIGSRFRIRNRNGGQKI